MILDALALPAIRMEIALGWWCMDLYRDVRRETGLDVEWIALVARRVLHHAGGLEDALARRARRRGARAENLVPFRARIYR